MGQIEDLRLLTLVVENRSISKAADQLHIAKSAVSRRLSLLEGRYGARLIDRRPGIWEVSATGRELYQRALRVVSDMDEIEADFSDTARDLTGSLSISVPRDFGLGYLMNALSDFKISYPEIQLMVDFDDRFVDLSRENYDFAIRITPKVEDNVVAQKIGLTRHQVYASPAYLAEKGAPSRPAELSDHAVLGYGTTRRTNWEFIDDKNKALTVEIQPVLNTNSGVFLLEAALKGLGLARLPDFIAAPSLAAGTLVPVLDQWRFADGGIYLVHAESRRLNKRMRLFAEEMKVACPQFGFKSKQST